MRYISTRGETAPQSFTDAVITGLAPDGGLLIPDALPDLRADLPAWRGLGFVDLAAALLPRFIDDIPADDLDALIRRAYAHFDHPEVVALTDIGDVQVLELFHGPTLAFKDIALQLLGQLFDYVLTRRGEHLNILGATSGDTGSAAIAGVRGQPAIDIYIMYPRGRISPLQELQMTTVPDANVHCLAVEGSFDDCQSLMKTLFADLDFKRELSLGAVNSVNWARVLAQIVYYGYVSLALADRGPVTCYVPTGNFGNVFAGYLARRMGFPIERLVVATNANDILARFFATGEYQRGDVHYTVTPAMDIQVASNFERFLYYHLDSDPAALAAFMRTFADGGCAALPAPPSDEAFSATAVSEEETLAAIRDTHARCGYLLDPHTAVGVAAHRHLPCDGPAVCLATAHPAKFPDAVNRALGADLAHHPTLDALSGLPTRSTTVPAELDAIRAVLRRGAAG